ncbi:hypothetical protein FS837_012703 [Tulasnella sp. UAMH 9824]|nr:hypothetical protein FS837_012703 [Tulasnella sp. UAMH 9824]
MLPADVAEHGRLDLQHEMLKKQRGGLFYAPQAIKRALAPREDSQPSVLDVGSGSGSWVIEMGRLFPHAEVVGLDLAPANLSSTPPPNCRFECDDANLGLLHHKGCFDVVNASCVTQGLGITNYRKFMDEVVEILRPGGVFLTVAGDLHVHDENRNILPLINEGEPAKGPGVDAIPKIYNWLQDQGNAWESIGQKIVYIPLGPWEDDMSEENKQISEFMRQNFFRMIQSVRPLLLSYGWFDETVDKWSAGAHEEVKILKNKYYIRVCQGVVWDGLSADYLDHWFFTWAIKPGQTI